MSNLTPTEAAAHRLRRAEKKCRGCGNIQIQIFDAVICRLGKQWPKFGYCKAHTDNKVTT